MTSMVFDTHAFVKRLTAAGMPEEQAEVLADEQAKLIDERLATKADLIPLAAKADLAALEARIVKWLVPLLLGQAALIVALVKLL